MSAEVWCYYEGGSYSASQGITPWITAVATAFGGVSGGGGESGSIFNGVNNAIGTFGMSGNQGTNRPAAYLNYIIFDQQYKVINMGWTVVPTSANFARQRITVNAPQIKEPGFVFVYLSYENAGTTMVNFDDIRVTHTRNNIIQYNEYYAFQHTTANSWTRENVTGNNFLGNGGTEVNATTQLYDLDFRNYDPLLGRMNGVDPMAAKYTSLTPYNYSFNNPLTFNDPSGADPPQTVNYSATYNQWHIGYTYDDRVDYTGMGDYICGQCWRLEAPGAMSFYNTAMGGRSGMFDSFNSWVDGRIGMRNIMQGIAAAWGTESGGSVDPSTGSVNAFTLFERYYETTTQAGVTDSEFLGYVLRDESGAMIWTNVRVPKFFVKLEELKVPKLPFGGNVTTFDDDAHIYPNEQLIFGYYEDTGFELEWDMKTRGFDFQKPKINSFKKDGYSYVAGKLNKTNFSIAYSNNEGVHEFHVSLRNSSWYLSIGNVVGYAARVMVSSDYFFNSMSDSIIGVKQAGIGGRYYGSYYKFALEALVPTNLGGISIDQIPRLK